MPRRPNKECAYPGCKELTRTKYCLIHKEMGKRKDEKRLADRRRGNSNSRGYGYRWRKAREQFLSLHPVCVHCQEEGLVKVATVVDHIKPHKQDQILFWDRDNWQALCKYHHDKKTASEDGGLGNKIIEKVY